MQVEYFELDGIKYRTLKFTLPKEDTSTETWCSADIMNPYPNCPQTSPGSYRSNFFTIKEDLTAREQARFND
jgi:hypothetical protein